MAERTASVRMAIGFMTSSSVEPPSSHERVADLPAGKESPAPRRSARMNGVYSSSTGHRSAAVPMMSSAASPRPTQQANDPAARRRNPRSPADPQAAGSRNNVWQAEQGVHIPQGEPTARQQEVVVGDRRTPATNRWVRFAWEPLAVEGGGREEQRRGRSSSTSAAGGFGGVAGDGVGDGRVPGTSGPTLPQGFSAGAARQGREKLGVKRFRPSPGDAFGEETEQAGSSFGGLVGAAPPDRTVWGLQTQAGESSPRRRRCSTTPRRDAFEVTGAAAARQADRGAAPPDPGSSLSLAPRELVGAAGVVTPPPPGGHDHAPLLAADRRDERQRVTRGINTRSSGAWGRGGDVHAMAEEEAQVGGNGTGATAAAAAAAAATYQGDTAYQQHHQEQGESYARGSSAKKPRYHRLHRTPSVGQMDTLTDGVGSLGVVSPRGTSDGGRREPTNAPRRRGFVSRRATLVGSTGDGNAFLPGPACPALSLGGVGRADQRAARARAGAQAQGCGMTRRSKAQSSATVGGPGQHQSKRRRNGSLAAGASSSFRNVVKPSVLPVDHDLAEASATLSAGAATAAAAATPRARRPSASRAGQADAVGGSDAQSSPNRRQRLAHLGSSGPPTAAAAAAANRGESEAEAGGCGAMDVEPTTEGQQERCCPCSSNSSSGGGGGGGSSSSTMPPPSTPHLPRTSSSLARLMMQQGAGKRGAPGFDAAVTASAAEASSAAAAATGANGGKGGLAAVAEGGGGGGADLDEDDNSSDGGAAHEDLSAWLHSTDDWWTS